jgi:hypothetical protein
MGPGKQKVKLRVGETEGGGKCRGGVVIIGRFGFGGFEGRHSF